MLKPGAIGAMTAMLDVPMRRWQKLCDCKGLTGDCRYRYRHDGKLGRNVFEAGQTSLSGTNQVGFDKMPVTTWSRLIATNDDMDATDLELGRLRYDYRLSENFRAAGAKVETNQRVAGLSAASPTAPLHMRQGDRGQRPELNLAAKREHRMWLPELGKSHCGSSVPEAWSK